MKVESETSCTRTKQENVKLRVFIIKSVSHLASIFGAPIKAEMLDSSILEVDLHDIHEMGHLGENQDPMVEDFEFGEDSVQELELSGGAENPIGETDFIIVF